MNHRKRIFHQSQLGLSSCDVLLLVGLVRLMPSYNQLPSLPEPGVGAIMRQRVQLRKLSPIAEYGFILPVGDWVLRHKLGHNTGGAAVCFYYGCICHIMCADCIISSVTPLSRLYRQQIELNYFSLLLVGRTVGRTSPPDGLDKHFSTLRPGGVFVLSRHHH